MFGWKEFTTGKVSPLIQGCRSHQAWPMKAGAAST